MPGPAWLTVPIFAICDAANVSADGKLNFLGEFDTITAVVEPIVHPAFTIVARFLVGAGAPGVIDLEIRVVSEDGALVAPTFTTRFTGTPPSDGRPAKGTLVMPVHNAHFATFGVFEVELWCGGFMVTSVPLFVRHASAGV